MTSANAIASAILVAILIAAGSNAIRGQGKAWLASKFLNRGAAPSPLDPVAASAPYTGTATYPGGSPVASGWGNPVPGALAPTPNGRFGAPRDRGGGRIDPHDGIDLRASMGTPVYASAAGTVRVANYPGSGLCGGRIEVDHAGGTHTLYCHLSAVSVRAGQAVTRGQMIGRVGGPGDAGAGNASAPHLHFEIRRNGVAVNPGVLIGF